MAKMDKHCMGCIYYKILYEELYYCTYIFQKGKRRPCEPGKGCTVKIEKEGKEDGNSR